MAQKKAKIGRPKLPKGEAKGRIVPVRFTLEDLKIIQSKARSHKQTLSECIRTMTIHDAGTKNTFDQMDGLIHEIRQRATEIRDQELYNKADDLRFLLLKYSGQHFDRQQELLKSK